MGAGGVEVERGGPGRAQGVVQVRIEPAGLAQLAPATSPGGADVPGQRLDGAAGAPHRVGVDDQARLVGRLQREVQTPVSPRRAGRLDQPEAGPHRPADGVALPVGQRVGEARPRLASRRSRRSPPVSAASHAPAAPGSATVAPGSREADSSGGRVARAAASASASTAEASTSVALPRPSTRANTDGGRARASARSVSTSGPVTTGVHLASSPTTLGSSRPRVVRSQANPATATSIRSAAPQASSSGRSISRSKASSASYSTVGTDQARSSTCRSAGGTSSRTSSGDASGLRGPVPLGNQSSSSAATPLVSRSWVSDSTEAANGCGRTRAWRPGRRGAATGSAESSPQRDSRPLADHTPCTTITMQKPSHHPRQFLETHPRVNRRTLW